MIKIYAVGGSVRDSLLGIESYDRDYVVVGATEQDMLNLGYTKVGADFPVFMAPNGDQYALARKERKTGKGYNGFTVEFDPSVTLKEDLERRDLTINSIAQDLETGEIIDYFGGLDDLKNKVLRHTSDAFSEDPLRVIRLARFSSKFPEFTIAEDTKKLCIDLVQSGTLNELHDNRIMVEITKVFTYDNFINFFLTLEKFSAFNKVNFFKDLFGYDQEYNIFVIEDIHITIANIISSMDINLVQKIKYFTVLFRDAYADMSSKCIPKNIKKLAEHFDIMIDLGLYGGYYNLEFYENIYGFLKTIKAYSDVEEDVQDIVNILYIMEECDIEWIFTSEDFVDFLNEAVYNNPVIASQFPNLTGKALGEAIENKRIENVKLAFIKVKD
jgi:tRNA nucleotidyltransferase (CCA-adding enzyme)